MPEGVVSLSYDRLPPTVIPRLELFARLLHLAVDSVYGPVRMWSCVSVHRLETTECGDRTSPHIRPAVTV